jgi:cytochrome c biogenesis protein ResB
VRRFFGALKSMKLAIGLIAYLAATGIISTLVPQGREAAYYSGIYPKLLAELLLQSGFTRFFTSLLFLVPALLFFSNLSACTADRFLREIRKPGGRRHGPDILHLGLMILVIGSVVSFSARQEGTISLAAGEGVQLPDGRVMTLRDFQYLTYEDGRPKDWVSTVDVLRDGKAEISSYPLRVNHPLRLGAMSVYQMSHSSRRVLDLRDPSGAERSLAQGDEAAQDGWSVFFMSADQASGKAILRVVDPAGKAEAIRVSPGDKAGPFVAGALRALDLTGLEAVKDPGYAIVLAALIVIAAGLFLTLFQKIGDVKA